MKAIIRIEGILENDNGSKKHGFLPIEINCPEFESKKEKLPKNNIGDLWVDISVENQIDDWFLNLDKDSIMNKYGIVQIIDWEVLKSSEENSNELAVIEKEFDSKFIENFALYIKVKENLSDQFIIDFCATYSKMYNSIKNLAKEIQIQITLDAQGVGYLAGTSAYENVLGILNGTNETFNEKLNKELKSEYFREFLIEPKDDK